MKTSLQIDLTFDQVLSVVRQLPRQEKIKLSKELEKESISGVLSHLLSNFKTDELDLETITLETESVRLEIYEKQIH